METECSVLMYGMAVGPVHLALLTYLLTYLLHEAESFLRSQPVCS